MKFELQVDGYRYELEICPRPGSKKSLVGKTKLDSIQSALLSDQRGNNGDRVCRSPVNGIVVRVNARVGDRVEADEPVMVLEAMKMETRLMAPIGGRLKELHVVPGQAVKTNQVLAEFE